jgi:hypothetical protein
LIVIFSLWGKRVRYYSRFSGRYPAGGAAAAGGAGIILYPGWIQKITTLTIIFETKREASLQKNAIPGSLHPPIDG